MGLAPRRARAFRARAALKSTLDVALAATLLLVLVPVVLVIALAIKIDSRGPIFYKSRRAGLRGAEFGMLKFRKMYDGAVGSTLTAVDDARFTRVGRLLARTKLDEVPQLFNVLKGQMSLVGPRPEDPSFVERRRSEFDLVLSVLPGITGLSQLAFAREPDVLDANDREGDYERRILPQKLQMDRLYAERRSFGMDLKILAWTVRSIVFGRSVAVHRSSARLTLRRRPKPAPAAATGHATRQTA